MHITKRKMLLTGVMLILILSLSACNNNSVPKVEHNDDPLWDVELEGANPEFIEDYIYMWDVLENEYPLLSTAERITGKDAESIKERYYKLIKTVDNPQDFYTYVINPCLNEFEYVGHLSPLDDQLYYNLYSDGKCFDEDYLMSYCNKQMTRSQSKEFYAKAIEKSDTHISGGEITESNKSYNTLDNLSIKYYREQSTAYVEIKTMNLYKSEDNPEYKALAEFFSKIEKEEYANCIIDIRQNPGGSPSYWIDGIVSQNCTKQFTTKNYGLIMGEDCKKYLEPLPWATIYPVSELQIEKMEKLNMSDLNDATHFWEMDFDYTPEECGEARFCGKFWLLTSGNVYSASESFAVFCKDTGFATLVGTRTGGDGVGFNPIVFSLPNTGICFRFSPTLGLNADGSGNEEFGTTPDYEIAKNEDALEKCLELIAEGK